VSIEAMKQALEALDAPSSPMLRIIQEEAITSLRQAISEFDSHTLYREGYVNGYAFGEAAGKRQAIEQASSVSSIQSDKISDAEKQEPVAWMDSDWHYQLHKKGIVVIHKDEGDVLIGEPQPLYTTPQPQQDAWKNAAIRLGEELSSFGPDGYYDMTAEQWLSWALDQQPNGKHSLPQPQREWVGLTQQDIDIAFDDTQEGGGFNEFAEAIEQILRRKNT
jgi:hypothetical protein